MYHLLIANELANIFTNGATDYANLLRIFLPLCLVWLMSKVQKIAKKKTFFNSHRTVVDIPMYGSEGLNSHYTDLSHYLSENIESSLDKVDGSIAFENSIYTLNEHSSLIIDFKKSKIKITAYCQERHTKSGLQRNTSYTITAGSCAIVQDFLEHVREWYIEKMRIEKTINLHVYKYECWDNKPIAFLKKFDQVILKDNEQLRIKHRLDIFINSKSHYESLGKPWHQGYLFHGPPGTGKSSLIVAIAAHIKWDIYAIAFPRQQNIANLLEQFRAIPEKSIVIIEEADTIPFLQKRSNKKEEKNDLLGVFLSLLDGLFASSSRITILTSNKPEKIDEAILRPGRIDYALELSNCNEQQSYEIFKSFFPNCNDYKTGDFANINVSPATISSICLSYVGDSKRAYQNISSIRSKLLI